MTSDATYDVRSTSGESTGGVVQRSSAQGKRTLTDRLPAASAERSAVQLSRGGPPSSAPVGDDPFGLHLSAVQLRGDGGGLTDDQVVDTAAHGVSGAGG